MKRFKLETTFIGICIGWGVCASSVAAPGELSDTPLFLGGRVQPNILLLMDDSGSMDWDTLPSNDAYAAHSGQNIDPNSNSNVRYMDFTPDNDTEKRELCAAYNVMAYDPAIEYTPWKGVDEDGNTYSDQTITAARPNPYDADNDDDISAHYYFEWNDDGDGIYESGECPTDSSDEVHVDTDLTADEQTNYANWYSYYRKREHVMKRAVSELITETSSRMGLATLHNNGSVGTTITDLDNITPATTVGEQADRDAAAVNKSTLLSNLFNIDSNGGTPLRQSLEAAGDYFHEARSTDLFGSSVSGTPILPDGSGGQCQQNFSVLLSDGYWNGSSPSVGNADADDPASEWDGASYADALSNTLADVAMYYYKTDLAPNIPDGGRTVPIDPGVDDNEAQHMVTYTVAFGLTGYITDDDMPTDRDTPFDGTYNPGDLVDPADDVIEGWPNPLPADSRQTIDDMRHAAWNGRGLFLNAKDPSELVASLVEAISDIDARGGSASAVSFNSTSVSSDTLVFQARFNADGWSGNLLAKLFTADGGASTDAEWEAGPILDDRTTARQIITSGGIYNGDTSTDGSTDNTRGIVFDFPASYPTLDPNTDLSQEQVDDLLTDLPAARTGPELVAYLRGDDTNEGPVSGLFRDRDGKRLGDIVHSSPQFVGVPNAGYPDTIEGTVAEDSYRAFVQTNADRTPIVYVGANDGMLHAFNAETGQEIFAYIPYAMFSTETDKGLHYLAQQDYRHKPYVDGSPFATDVFISDDWRTYLVGGYRAGGKGIYALDITDPSTLANAEGNAGNIVKMEFTHSDLGYTFSRPLVGKLNNGKWAAIFGNGYNNDPSGDGKAKLFIVYLDGSGYEMIDTQVGYKDATSNDCTNVASDCNGLSSPAILDITGDAVIDRVYAGDLHGNMWVFDLSSDTTSDWDVAYSSGSPTVPQPLFQACSADPCTSSSPDTRQPITSRPVVSVHPKRIALSTEPNLLVYFGTGQYIAEYDNASTGTQTLYGIWDTGAYTDLDRGDLEEQTITESSITVQVDGSINTTSATLRNLSNNAVNYNPDAGDLDPPQTPEFGWYIDLPSSGERSVVAPLVSGDLVFFNTIIPDTTPCGAGSGFIMFADRLTGGEPPFAVIDANNDGVLDSDDLGGGISIDALPGGSRIIDGIIVTSDSSGNILDQAITSEGNRAPKRSSWSTAR